MKSNQLITNAEALRLFFNEDVYLVGDNSVSAAPDVAPSLPPEKDQADPIPPPVAAVSPEPKKIWEFKYLGKNQKKILILVNDHQNPVSTPQGTELLRKLVKAIQLTNNDFALVNHAHYPDADFQAFEDFFNCELLLAFGVEATTLRLAEMPLHQLSQYGRTRIICTINLHDLDSDINSKKILWATLQNLKS